jgi:hypothetical protein
MVEALRQMRIEGSLRCNDLAFTLSSVSVLNGWLHPVRVTLDETS